eukprot:m.308138 g.308138  ORF g.308138 m.308138 type:complete len:177 (+) comp43441_c0_seq1:1607-2137(+)
MVDWPALVVAIAVPNLGGVIIGFVVSKNLSWYAKLKKPSFNPPNWLFGVAWTILYTLMGVASYLIYEDGGFEKNLIPLLIYAGNLIFNFLWSIIFFGLHFIMLGFFDIVVVVVSAVAIAVVFYPVNHVATYLLIPYIAWGLFASLLNFAIWSLNGPGPGSTFQTKKPEEVKMQEVN